MRQSVVFTVGVAPPLSKRERETRRVSGNTSSIDARPSIDVTTYNLNLDPGLHPYWTITTAMEELHHDDRTAEGSRVAAFDPPWSQSGGGIAARGLLPHSCVSFFPSSAE